MLSKERTINNWRLGHGYTSLGGSPDNIVLLGVPHVRHLGSGSRSTPRQNLVPARILCVVVQAGGGTVPTLPRDLAEL